MILWSMMVLKHLNEKSNTKLSISLRNYISHFNIRDRPNVKNFTSAVSLVKLLRFWSKNAFLITCAHLLPKRGEIAVITAALAAAKIIVES